MGGVTVGAANDSALTATAKGFGLSSVTVLATDTPG